MRLERMQSVEITGECASGAAAIAAIEDTAPDVVLLDVQMPELDGFDVVEAVGVNRMPVTIFVTAYDEHAIRAFEAHALDYLLKPVDDVRFVHAIDRARTVVAERNSHVRARALVQAIAAPLAPRRRIVLHERGRVLILEHKDIDWIAAEGDYVRVHAAGKGYLVRNTMAATEARLDPALFARIHRSTIVRIDAVREVRSEGDRHWLVVLRDRTKLRMSRLYRSRLPL